MPSRILGIDIGSYSIKVAEIERSFRSFQLVAFYEQPIVFQEGHSREAMAAQALETLVEEYHLVPDLVYSALPGQMTSHRVIDLPFSDFKKVDATIEFELENYLPLPIEELQIDYQTLTSDKTGTSALVSYVRKSDLVKFLNVLSEADLDPRTLGSEPVELADVMKLGIVPPEGAYALLDIGHEKTNVCIFIGPQCYFVRTLLIGGKDFTHAISTALNVPFEEAERMKIELAQVGADLSGADQTTRSLSEALTKGPLAELTLHLRQTFMAFQEKKTEVVQAVLLSGGSSRLVGIDSYLSQELRKNVSFLDCLDLPFNQLSESDWCRPIAPTALALAYRGITGTGVKEIQFRRGEFAYRGEIKEIMSLTKQIALCMGVVIAFALTSFFTSYFSLKSRAKSELQRVELIAKEILPDASKRTLSSPTAIVSSLAGRITEAEDKRKKVEENLTMTTLDILKELTTVLPLREKAPIQVDKVNILAKKIRIQASTNSIDSFEMIKAALSQSRIFKNLSTENVKKVKEEIRFELSMDVSTEVAAELPASETPDSPDPSVPAPATSPAAPAPAAPAPTPPTAAKEGA